MRYSLATPLATVDLLVRDFGPKHNVLFHNMKNAGRKFCDFIATIVKFPENDTMVPFC